MTNRAIEKPATIAALPHYKGLPVPAMVQFDSLGVPDFKVIDMEKWGALMSARKCGICGQAMGNFVWFVGGPLCHLNRLFTDLPMHHACAIFALRTCPYLALPRYKFIMKDVVIDGVEMNINEHVTTKRPDAFGLFQSAGYQLAMLEGSPAVLLLSKPFKTVQWWRHGEAIAS